MSQWVSSIKTRIKTQFWVTENSSSVPQWVSSIKTRIKTPLRFSLLATPSLNEYLPLKQGLRQCYTCDNYHKCKSQWVSSIKTRIKTRVRESRIFTASIAQWVSSIKTRIKTSLLLANSALTIAQWVSSIKTRIKTPCLILILCKRKLNEYLPLKQGLRRFEFLKFPPLAALNEYLPLKQGLRHIVRLVKVCKCFLNEYLPLKQGLRLGFFDLMCKRPFSMSIFH